MSVVDIVKRIESDGIRLALSDSGSLKAIGDSAAVNRWQPILREHKSEIIAALRVENNVPIPVLSHDDEASIFAWLVFIGETDPVTIGELIDRCRSDTEARAYFVGRAAVELPRPDGSIP